MTGLLLALLSLAAHAHRFDPALLVLQESSPEVFDVRWRPPVGATAPLAPLLPCPAVTPWQIRCPGGLAGVVGVEGLAEAHTDALLRVRWADGRTASAILTAEAPSVQLDRPPQRLSQWVWTGAEHVLLGLDHLFFLLCLLLLVRGGALIRAVTAFTGGHAITLALGTAGYALPTAPVEACIAASVVLLAREASLPDPRSLLVRRPGLAAGGFGLVHGLGFAYALADLELPAASTAKVLLGFHVGIEAGQVLFLLAALGPVALWRRLPGRFRPLLPSLVGGVALLWTMERVAAF